jgi:hypothetical protein
MSSQFSADVADSTLAMYHSNLRTIAKGVGVTDWIKNTDWIFKHQTAVFALLDETPNIHTRKNRVSSLLWFAELHKTPAPVIYRLKALQMDCFAKLQKGYVSNEMTDKVEGNWITVEDIDAKIEELEKVAGQKYTPTVQYLMLLFHRHLPIRNDLRLTKITHSEPTDTDSNYLVKSGDKWTLVMNIYKTEKKYGQKVIPVPDVVGDELTKYTTNGDWFYATKKGEPVSTQQFTNTFKRIFEDEDKAVGTTQIRRTIVSSVHQPKPNELKKKADLANIMGHSVSTAQTFYAKVGGGV